MPCARWSPAQTLAFAVGLSSVFWFFVGVAIGGGWLVLTGGA